eukprot:TRINITY_DN62662_c0_g1_i1.p1 TRINITY_DN62662_c0_g1~~TRINITY_DN62662_c0_g1_i1.p1  ORF type:complete len:275 (-),score=55.24 TRINITY_DN62662_c0_g1_i1:140-964(-)
MPERDRSRSPQLGDCSTKLETAKVLTKKLCDTHGIPASHGFSHALRVLEHVNKALEKSERGLSAERCLSVRLAALLHDIDDRKYFPNCPTGEYPNAAKIMRDANVSEELVQDALQMLGYVSCSKNGNSLPHRAVEEPEILWPRWADRLEAAGEIGAVRCWQYNREKGDRPLFTEKTPTPSTEDAIWKLATEERFEAYQRNPESESMLDHYYDKLLRVACPPLAMVKNAYLEDMLQKGAAPLVHVLLVFANAGDAASKEQALMEELKAMEAKVKA